MRLFWKVLIKTFLTHGHQVICVVPYGDKESDSDLLPLGVGLIHYNLDRKGLNPLKDLRSSLELGKIFHDEKPDLLFASTIKPVIYGSIAAKISRVPRIFAAITGLGFVFEADSFLKKIINLLGRTLYRVALANISGVFFQNRDDLALFKSLGLIKNVPVFMARGTGVDIDHFSPAPFPDDGNCVFLLVARLLEAKGLREYAEAARILASKWPNARFQLVGPKEKGPGAIDESSLDSWIKDGIIEYLGETRDVRPFLAASHVAVLPSWREGLPTSIMEAMAMGRPVVLADSPGCRELVKPGENGFLAVCRDASSLAEEMEKFLLGPELIAKMGKKSRELACQHYDAELVARHMYEIMIASGT